MGDACRSCLTKTGLATECSKGKMGWMAEQGMIEAVSPDRQCLEASGARQCRQGETGCLTGQSGEWMPAQTVLLGCSRVLS